MSIFRDAWAFRRASQRAAWATRRHIPANGAAVLAFDLAKADAAKYAAAIQEGDTKKAATFRRYAPTPPSLTWQARDKTGSPFRSPRHYANVDSPADYGLRHVGDVIPESRRGRIWGSGGDGCGWFTNDEGLSSRDGEGLVWGVVYQLPGRGGRSRFVAGWQDGGTDAGPTIDLGRVYEGRDEAATDARDHTAAREAAHAADELARVAADEEREYQSAWRAGQEWAEKGDEIATARDIVRAAIQQARAARRAFTGDASQFARLCELLRSAVRERVERVHELRRERAALVDSCPTWQRAAFCDGAGLDQFPA